MPVQGVVTIPDDVPYEIGALIGCGVTTGVGAALNTAKVKPGSTVVVFGAGGVGIAAIQGARIAGAAEIVAVDTVPAKLEDAKRFGATHGTDPNGLDALNMQINSGEGFDYAIECIGLPQTIRASYDAVRRGGTAVIVGAGSSEAKVEFNAFELFFMEKKILGSYYGSANVRTEFPRLIRLWRAGRLDLDGMISRQARHLAGAGRVRRHEARRGHPPDPHLLRISGNSQGDRERYSEVLAGQGSARSGLSGLSDLRGDQARHGLRAGSADRHVHAVGSEPLRVRVR